MTPPMPPGLVRSSRTPAPSPLERAKRHEPVRLYAYSILAAVLVVLAAVGWVTEDVSAALTGVLAAVLAVVPTAEAARASVYSPATRADLARLDEERWTAMTYGRNAA